MSRNFSNAASLVQDALLLLVLVSISINTRNRIDIQFHIVNVVQ